MLVCTLILFLFRSFVAISDTRSQWFRKVKKIFQEWQRSLKKLCRLLLGCACILFLDLKLISKYLENLLNMFQSNPTQLFLKQRFKTIASRLMVTWCVIKHFFLIWLSLKNIYKTFKMHVLRYLS